MSGLVTLVAWLDAEGLPTTAVDVGHSLWLALPTESRMRPGCHAEAVEIARQALAALASAGTLTLDELGAYHASNPAAFDRWHGCAADLNADLTDSRQGGN